MGELDRPVGSSPQFMVESPPETLSPSHERVFRDDLSPVSDRPTHGKRKIAINIGASPSGFILEEEEEEENDAELEVVDARMFRPIVEPQFSGDDQPTDYEPDVDQPEVPDDDTAQPSDAEEVLDVGDDGVGQSLDEVAGQENLCDGPGEVSDHEDVETALEDFEVVDDGIEIAMESDPQDADVQVVPDVDLLIQLDDDLDGSQNEIPLPAEDFPPPPPLLLDQDGDDDVDQ